MASWIWGTSPFDDSIDKATSELNVAGTEDIALNLEIADQIRSKSVLPKDAMRAVKRRLNHTNPNVQLLTLSMLDLCIKNGGDHFLVEIASREFMDNLVSILKVPSINREVRETMLRLLQSWALGFEGRPALTYVGEVYKRLGKEGFTFPPIDSSAANSAMVDSMTAPEWIDSDVCLRCRTAFTMINRKHHCRNCGQVFDQACSSKNLPLPHFGITTDVRVCDSCFVKLKIKHERPTPGPKHHHKSHSHSHSRSGRAKSANQLADEELQRAIQLSLEESRQLNSGRGAGYVPSWPAASEPPVFDQKIRSSQPQQDEEDDPELRAAIEASLREYQEPKPSAPDAEDGQADPGLDLHPLESDAIITFSQTVEEAQSRGTRDLVRYPGVGELYDRANKLRPKLAISLDDTGRKEQILSEMHEKLSEAVKLYDRILTEQVNPARRYNQYYASQQQRQPAVASHYPALASGGPGPSYQPQQAEPPAAPSQWNQSQMVMSPGQDYGQNYQYQQSAQSPYPLQPQRQQSYQQQQQVAAAPAPPPPQPPTTYSNPPMTSQQQQYQPQPLMSPTPASPQNTSGYDGSSVIQHRYEPVAPMPGSATYPGSIGTVASPPPQPVQQQYNMMPPPPSAPTSYAPVPPPATASPPPQAHMHSSFGSMPPPPGAYTAQSQSQPFPPPPSSPLNSITSPSLAARQMTLPATSAPPQTQSSVVSPQQSLSYTPTPINPVYMHMTAQSPPPTQPLPSFPLAPTTAPHNSSTTFMYSGPPSVGIEQSQPKEALLISFD